MKLIYSNTKQEVKIGDKVADNVGNEFEVYSWTEPQPSFGYVTTGRVHVKYAEAEHPDCWHFERLHPKAVNCEFIN